MPHIDEVMITVTQDPGKHFSHSVNFRTYVLQPHWGFLGGSVVKNPPVNSGDARDKGSIPGSRRFPGGRNGNPVQCSCLENPQGQESLAGYSPWNCKQPDMTEQLLYYFII